MRFFWKASVFIFIGLVTGAPVRADQTPAPDKSGYTLFNPTPDSALRELSADRPVKSILPITVDAGHVQVEADLANYGFGTYAGVTTKVFLAANPLIKLGITNYADLEIQLGSYQSIQVYDAATQIELAHRSGYGDILVKAKINFIGNDGGDLAFAMVPFIKIPSSVPLLSNNAVEGGLTASLQYKLPGDYLFVASPEFDLLKNASDFGTHAGYRGAVSIGHAIPGIDKLSGIIEFYAQGGTDPLIPPVYTADIGLGYLPTPNCQIDGGVNIGLNDAAPRLQFYAGITQRF